MIHIYKGSTIKIKPTNFEQGGTILFYTVNPSYGTAKNEVGSDGIVTLEWEDLENMGRGVLNYKVNNPNTAKDYHRTTLYFIDTDSVVGDDESLGTVSDKLKRNVTDKVEQELQEGLTTLTGIVENAISHLPYIGEDHYIYEWSEDTQAYNRTSKYLKGDRGETGVMRKILHESTDNNVTINPNEFHVWEEVDTLTINLIPSENQDYVDEYAFRFKTGNTPTTLNLPPSITIPRTFITLPHHVYTCTVVSGVLEFGGQSL